MRTACCGVNLFSHPRDVFRDGHSGKKTTKDTKVHEENRMLRLVVAVPVAPLTSLPWEARVLWDHRLRSEANLSLTMQEAP